MPDPEVSPSIKRLSRWSKDMQKTYGGFEPGRLKKRAERVAGAVKSAVSAPKDVVEDAAGAVKDKAGVVQEQAKSDLKSVRSGLKKLTRKLGL